MLTLKLTANPLKQLFQNCAQRRFHWKERARMTRRFPRLSQERNFLETERSAKPVWVMWYRLGRAARWRSN